MAKVSESPCFKLPTLSLYIHVPWCEKKCPYCDFNSHVSSAIPEKLYIEKLIDDLRGQLNYVQERKLHSIFIGGGTPSLFSPTSYNVLLAEIQSLVEFEDDIEITIEANPSSSEQEKFIGFKQAGINRLSIGIQSFNPQHLKTLGRIHDPQQAILAAQVAHDLGLRFNLDLMHGLPEQSLDQAMTDLQQAIDLGAKHISWYQLTIEQNTEFYRYPPTLPEEDTLADIQDAGFTLLGNNGFSQYEISAFSKAGEQAKHNLNYWLYGDYLAIGAGAHGKITDTQKQQVVRYNNTRLPKDYLNRMYNYTAQKQVIDTSEVLIEALMNSLRLNEGINTVLLLDRTAKSLDEVKTLLTPLISKNLATLSDKTKATSLGRSHLNTVLEKLLS